MQVPLKERARGRWREILPAFGIESRFLRNKHGPCPICSDGTDRFRFDDKKGEGTYYCSQCGPGDGIRLIEKVTGLPFKEVNDRITEIIGEAKSTVVVKEPKGVSEEDSKTYMNRLWKSSTRVYKGSLVDRYLQSRGIDLKAFPDALRDCPEMRYPGGKTSSFHPGMVALMRDPEGNPAILHRTFLHASGQKAMVENPRLIMPGDIAPGSSVRLMEHGEELGVGEGIETSFAASILFRCPAWAALNSHLLENWEPPKGVKRIRVFGDNDPKYGGQAAAYRLAHRLAVKSKDKTPLYEVTVHIPDETGEDWNDVLLSRGPWPLV